MKRPFEIWMLIALLLILSIGALYGGGLLILSPDGALLGINPSFLNTSIFTNYRIPGYILFVLIGVFPMTIIFGLLMKPKLNLFSFLNFFTDKHWSWTFSIYSGIITITWIIMQQLLAAYFILQPIIAAIGLLIIIFTLLPRVQRFYSNH